jgi:hypothetical protein
MDPEFNLGSSRTRRRSNHIRCIMAMTSQWEFPESLFLFLFFYNLCFVLLYVVSFATLYQGSLMDVHL